MNAEAGSGDSAHAGRVGGDQSALSAIGLRTDWQLSGSGFLRGCLVLRLLLFGREFLPDGFGAIALSSRGDR